MRIAGIVAEYNPFHLGHQHQIRETRRRLGEACGIVCVMSGDFVQRGEAAVFSKYARAEAAVRCGADLVIELPLPWCISSAEGFARGAVGLLTGLGVVDTLSFGSESGNAELLAETANCLDSECYREALHRYLAEGRPFAVCRQKAVEAVSGAEYGEVLSRPNDNLAVEYLRAVRRCGTDMEPLAIQRIGAGHDDLTPGAARSGAALRQMLVNGIDISREIPPSAAEVFQREIKEGRGPVTPETMEPLLLSRLRMLDAEDFARLPDAAEGLERKLFSACRTQPNMTAIYDTVKSKRYAHARIRRMTLSAALGITKNDIFESPPYARILAFNDWGSVILRKSKETGTIPILSKPTEVRTMEASSQAVFQRTAKAHDLFALAYPNAGYHAGGQDWRETPRYLSGLDIELS